MASPSDPRTSETTAPSDTEIGALVARALEEDVGSGDVTTLATVPPGCRGEATIASREDGTAAGLRLAQRVFHSVDPNLSVGWMCEDGAEVRAGDAVGRISGNARAILQAERTALNFLQRMSGIATATRRMVRAAGRFPARICDTRKTAPGLRLLDKWAIRLGGGANHRHGLHDMILIKDNHIAAAGGVRAALRAASAFCESSGRALAVEIETGSLDEVREALLTGGFDCMLLDNMVRTTPDGFVDTSMLREAVSLVGGRFATEASGNVTLATVAAIAAAGVDYISCGALTHSVCALDLALEMRLAETRAAGVFHPRPVTWPP